MVPAVHLVIRSREPCPQSRKLSRADPRHQPLDCDREYLETHLFSGCSAFCNCNLLRRALYLRYCDPSHQLLKRIPETRDEMLPTFDGLRGDFNPAGPSRQDRFDLFQLVGIARDED